MGNSYDLYRNLIKTGDVISFSGKGRVSSIIKRFTNSDISHIGMAAWMPFQNMQDRLFIVESTTLNESPDITGEYRRGVQMSPLSQRIEGFTGDSIWWHPLEETLSDQKEKQLVTWLLKAHTDRIDYDVAQAIASGLDPSNWNFLFRLLTWPFGFIMNTNPNLERMFCSELCAAGYQHIGLLPQSINPSEMHPEDLVRLGIFKDKILLCQ